MKQPTIEVEGIQYPVENIDWLNGRLYSANFYDAQGKYQIVFNLWHKDETEGFDERGFLHMDLDKHLKGGE